MVTFSTECRSHPGFVLLARDLTEQINTKESGPEVRGKPTVVPWTGYPSLLALGG